MKFKSRYIILFACLLISTISSGQYFAILKVNTKKVFKQQPIKASVTVYTSTWFTDSPDFGSININNSFVLPFKRTVSGIQYVDNKKYATLEFFYLIFPYESGSLTIPELEISISTPLEGDYKGVKRQLKTKPVVIEVTDQPDGFKGSDWFVAKDAYISDSWNTQLNKVQVGDVIERTITVRALGTLPAFIPDIELNENNWSTIYPREPQLKDTRTRTDANGVRTESFRYLVEKEGEFIIPAVSVSWWNPYLNKQYSRSTKEQKIDVTPNPDLGILTTMRDSLNAEIPQQIDTNQEQAVSIFGLTIREFIILVVIVLLAFWLIAKLIKTITHDIKQRRERYLNSEQYWFDKIKQEKQSPAGQLHALYNWLLIKKEKRYSLEDTENKDVIDMLQNYYLGKESTPLTSKQINKLKKQKKKENKNLNLLPPLNP